MFSSSGKLAVAIFTCLALPGRLSGAATVPGPLPSKTPIAVQGVITAEVADKAIGSLNSGAATAPPSLLVESSGGEGEAALKLARAIHARRADITVRRVCAVFCAVYLLPAAHRVTFEKGAVLFFVEMPSPRIYSNEAYTASMQELTPQQRDIFTQRQANFKKLLLEQDQFYRSMGFEPGRLYRTVDIWAQVNKALGRGTKDAQKVGIVPDQRFLEQCLKWKTIEWRSLSPQDSVALAHLGKTPLAAIVDGEVYYEGAKVPMERIEC